MFEQIKARLSADLVGKVKAVFGFNITQNGKTAAKWSEQIKLTCCSKFFFVAFFFVYCCCLIKSSCVCVFVEKPCKCYGMSRCTPSLCQILSCSVYHIIHQYSSMLSNVRASYCIVCLPWWHSIKVNFVQVMQSLEGKSI